MDANDFPHGIFWQMLHKAGANLKLLEKKLNDKLIYIQSPETEAHKACAKVTDDKLLLAMRTHMDNRNYVYAIWLFKNTRPTNN